MESNTDTLNSVKILGSNYIERATPDDGDIKAPIHHLPVPLQSVLLALLPAAEALLNDKPGEYAHRWFPYQCDNGAQSLSRMVSFMEFDGVKMEVQLNLFGHANSPHCHSPGSLASFMLVGGYYYFLRQYPSAHNTLHFAAPGSILTMNPPDTHWIPQYRTRAEQSLSLCIIDVVTDWHKFYPPLPENVAENMHTAAILSMRKNIKSLISQFDEMLKEHE